MSYVDVKSIKSFYLLLPSSADHEETMKGPYPIERLQNVMRDFIKNGITHMTIKPSQDDPER